MCIHRVCEQELALIKCGTWLDSLSESVVLLSGAEVEWSGEGGGSKERASKN